MSDNEGPPRNKQLNLKVSDACKALFLAMVATLDTKNADLFEDMVALKMEELERLGVKVEVDGFA